MSTDPNYGGFTAVARKLNELHPEREHPYTRQAIHSWWSRRAINNFPTRHDVTATSPSGAQRTRGLFDVDEVVAWFNTYTPKRGGRRTGSGNKPKQLS